MNEWAYQSATAMARAIRERRIGCVELLDLHLERVRRHNPTLNAIIALDSDRARSRAREADERPRAAKPGVRCMACR